MSVQILFRREAEADLHDAYDWYETQSQGLGEDFLLCVEAAINQVKRNPKAFQTVYRKVRRALLRRFPYGIFYTVSEQTIVVVAVFHAKRDPKRWRRR